MPSPPASRTRRAPATTRLQKLLAAAGVASRRKAEELIRAGRVTVNGRPARIGDGADPERDAVAVDGVPIEREPLAYWIVHKPRGAKAGLVTLSGGRRMELRMQPERIARLVRPERNA